MNGSWKKRLAITLVVCLVGSWGAASADTSGAVTGHTVYSKVDTDYDKCLAGIVGMVNQKVTWFNGQTLFKRSASGSGLWVYATESLGDDAQLDPGLGPENPDDAPLIPSGREPFRFEDPNWNQNRTPGLHKVWEVHEFQQVDPVVLDTVKRAGDTDSVPEQAVEDLRESAIRYVYAIKINDETIHDEVSFNRVKYNFVTLVDTCKFRTNAAYDPVVHDPDGDWDDSDENYTGVANPENPDCDRQNTGHHGDCTWVDHDDASGKHDHAAYNVDLFVGDEPNVLQIDSEEATGGPTVDPDGDGPQ